VAGGLLQERRRRRGTGTENKVISKRKERREPITVSEEGMGKPIPYRTRHALQGIQERKQCLLILGAQFLEAVPYVFGFAGVTFDGAL